MLSMVMSMVAPGFIGRAPGPVPQAMRSPGCFGRLEEKVGERIILSLAAVQRRANGGPGEVSAGHDRRAKRAKGVIPFGARPLRKGRVEVKRLQCGDVVDASVAEDCCCGVVRRYGSAVFTDDDTELRLIDHAAIVICRLADDATRREPAAWCFQKKQRIIRLAEALFFGDGAGVVPECQHLAWLAGRGQSHVGQGAGLAGWRRFGKYVAGMDGDDVAIKRAKTAFRTILMLCPLKTNPLRHSARAFSGHLLRKRSGSWFGGQNPHWPGQKEYGVGRGGTEKAVVQFVPGHRKGERG